MISIRKIAVYPAQSVQHRRLRTGAVRMMMGLCILETLQSTSGSAVALIEMLHHESEDRQKKYIADALEM